MGASIAGCAAISSSLLAEHEFGGVLIIAFGPLAVALSVFLSETIYAGIAAPLPWSEGEREWLARASSIHIRRALIWAGVIATPVLGSKLVFYLLGHQLVSAPTLTLGTGLAGFLTSLVGKARQAADSFEGSVKTIRRLSLTTIATILTPLVLFATLSLLAALVEEIVFLGSAPLTGLKLPAPEPNAQQAEAYSAIVTRGAWLSATSSAVAFLLSYFTDINAFSLHALYRNRLARAFLGASNAQRSPNPLTGFDERDNLSMSSLWPNGRGEENRIPPQFHVVNVAMDVVATTELVWQERKAMPFVFTPLHAGSGQMRGARGAYRAASQYGSGVEPPQSSADSGLSLGTAITISGAAASPNMGYRSVPAMALLMTMFNVRLGAWKGNPAEAGEHTFWRRGPLLSAKPLIYEALGKTEEDRPYVYLSDGGHFENLAVYEMIRRRCRLILVSDAGCDPHFRFEDLGNALRKISIDLKVTIAFSGIPLKSRGDADSSTPYHCVAKIRYSDDPEEDGLLLYVKPTFRGDEPPAVLAYALAHDQFPHESTANQFFGEAQFEAYRALGEHVIGEIARTSGSGDGSVRSFIEAAIRTKQSTLEGIAS